MGIKPLELCLHLVGLVAANKQGSVSVLAGHWMPSANHFLPLDLS